MSREIKFRILDKKSKSFITRPENLLLGNKYYIDCSGNIIIRDTIDFLHETNKDNYELMQYTGIKDKNGVEIYEGDILKYKYLYDRRFKYLSLVKFMETEASFGLKDIYGNEIPLYRITANNYFEVVGNIYENPELLEEKNG